MTGKKRTEKNPRVRGTQEFMGGGNSGKNWKKVLGDLQETRGGVAKTSNVETGVKQKGVQSQWDLF